MSNTQSAPHGVPFYNTELEKEYRAHIVSKSQWIWVLCWLGVAIVLLAQPWIFLLKIAGILFIAISVVGFIKSEDGPWHVNVQEKMKSKAMQGKGKGEISIKTKKPPFLLRIVGFPTEVSDVEFSEYEIEMLGEEELDRMAKQANAATRTIGTIYSKQENSDTGFVGGTGIRSANSDPTTSFIGRTKVVNALSQVALEADTLPSFSLIYSTRPLNMTPYLDWYDASVERAVTSAQPIELRNLGIDPDDDVAIFDEETFFNGSFEERQATALTMTKAHAAVTGQEPTMVIGVTVERPQSWGKAKDGSIDGKLSAKQLQDAPVTNLVQLLQQELENAGVSDASAFSEEDVDKFVHEQWDIKKIGQWRSNLRNWATYEALKLFQPELLPPLQEEEIPKRPSAWPEQKIVAGTTKSGKTYLFADGTYFITLQARKFSQRQVFADDFFPMFMSQDIEPSNLTGLTVSVCGDVVDVASEQAMLTRKIMIQQGVRNSRKGEQYRFKTPADREKEAALENKQYSLHLGGKFAFSYNVYVTLSATTPALLEKMEKRIRTHSRKSGIKLRYIPYESRQLRALVSAIFGVSMATR